MILDRPPRFAIYTRISRDRVGAGLGVERQLEDCQALVDQIGGETVLTLTDNDISAYSGKSRPGYLSLLEAMCTGHIDAVVTWHADRLHRSMIELEEYALASKEHSVATHTVRAGAIDLSTPSGRLVARQLGAVARYEVEHSIERQKAAKLQAAKAGKYGGGLRPYGYKADGVTIEPSERDVLLEMADRIIGGESYRQIALDLNARGITTSRGGMWRALKIPNVVSASATSASVNISALSTRRNGQPYMTRKRPAGSTWRVPPTRHSRDSAAVDVSISLRAS
jgi:site-specific DNA recombinase